MGEVEPQGTREIVQISNADCIAIGLMGRKVLDGHEHAVRDKNFKRQMKEGFDPEVSEKLQLLIESGNVKVLRVEDMEARMGEHDRAIHVDNVVAETMKKAPVTWRNSYELERIVRIAANLATTPQEGEA